MMGVRLLSSIVAIAFLGAACSPVAEPKAVADVDCKTSGFETSFADVVRDADQIVLATALASAPSPNAQGSDLKVFTFHTVEKLKGKSKRKFKVTGYPAEKNDDGFYRSDLDAHTRMSFWDRVETRLVHVSSCVQTLTFREGVTYLLIDPEDDMVPMSIAYEQIADQDNDLWLDAVRSMIKDSARPAREMSLEDYLKSQQSAAFVVMPYCNEKLKEGGFRVAELSEPLVGPPVRRDSLDPKLYADALTGCDGMTVHLALFYQPDQSRPEDAVLGAEIYPGQHFIPVINEEINVADIPTEVTITGPQTISLADLIALLKGA